MTAAPLTRNAWYRNLWNRKACAFLSYAACNAGHDGRISRFRASSTDILASLPP
jgi:hypothetical protein